MFAIGFGWFLLAPLVPALASELRVSVGAVLFAVSEYGLAMVVLGLVAGWLSARLTVKRVLLASAVLSAIGLTGRAMAVGYASFLALQSAAAAAYPLALAPIGSIAQAASRGRSHAVVGASVGVLFLGMAVGSLLGARLYVEWGLHGALYAAAALSVVALALLSPVSGRYPARYERSLRGSFRVGMLKNWYVGFAVASLSVMFSSIASTMLQRNGLAMGEALIYGGELGGLAFLGSAIGAASLPALFEQAGRVRLGMVSTGLLTFVLASLLGFFLAFTADVALLYILFFLLGAMGNAFWSMAMASTTKYVEDPAKAGLATSMYSVATNLGVTVVPSLLGAMFEGNPPTAVAAVIVISLAAFLASPFLKAD